MLASTSSQYRRLGPLRLPPGHRGIHRKLSELLSEVRQVTKGMEPVHEGAKRWKNSAVTTVVFLGARLPTYECQPPAKKTTSETERTAAGCKRTSMRQSTWRGTSCTYANIWIAALALHGYQALNDASIRVHNTAPSAQTGI